MLRINICEFAERMEQNGTKYVPAISEIQKAKSIKHKEMER